jgi:predicted RNA-binding protein with PIN domain
MRISNEKADRSAAQPPRDEWLIDGYNVIHAGLLGAAGRREWWRAEHRARLEERCREFAERANESAQPPLIWLVFDGTRPGDENDATCAESPSIVFAPSADDWIVKRVRGYEDPQRLNVVTGDRQVADRCRHAGAQVVSPRAFLRRCEEDPPDSSIRAQPKSS